MNMAAAQEVAGVSGSTTTFCRLNFVVEHSQTQGHKLKCLQLYQMLGYGRLESDVLSIIVVTVAFEGAVYTPIT